MKKSIKVYNFIFWFFYRVFERTRGIKSTLLASSTVALAIIIHLGVIHSVIRYYTGQTISKYVNNYPDKKMIIFPIILISYLITYLLYYKPRTEKILSRYKDRKPFTWQNILLVILIMVVPLVFAAIVTNMAVAKFKAMPL